MAEPGITLFRPEEEATTPERDDLVVASPEEAVEIQRLEAEIAAKRERVVASFGELRRRVEGATDWRRWVRRHPVPWIAAAVSVGFFIGYRGGPTGRR